MQGYVFSHFKPQKETPLENNLRVFKQINSFCVIKQLVKIFYWGTLGGKVDSLKLKNVNYFIKSYIAIEFEMRRS